MSFQGSELEALRERAEKAEAELANANNRESDLRREHREKAHDNYWAWQGDGDDHLESLSNACPVLIHSEALREIIRERDRAQAAYCELREALREIAEASSNHEPTSAVWAAEALKKGDTATDRWLRKDAVAPLVEWITKLRGLVPLPPDAITYENGVAILDFVQGDFLPKATTIVRSLGIPEGGK